MIQIQSFLPFLITLDNNRLRKQIMIISIQFSRQLKHPKHLKTEHYPVPTDVFCEIAEILLQTGLPHEIVAIKENRRAVVLCISYEEKSKFHQAAISNLEEILKSYHELCFDDRTSSWRDY